MSEVSSATYAPNPALKPYYERSLRAAESERLRPFTPYRAPRIEGMTRDQLAALRGIRSIQMPGAMKDSQNLYGRAARLAGREANFQAGTINARYNPRAVAMFAHPGTSKMFAKPSDLKMFAKPGDSKMFARPDDVNMFARPEDVKMFARPGDISSKFQSGIFGTEAAQQYMNPYTQAVLDITKREAERAHEKQGVERNLQAAKMGAFGGSRAAIMESEAQRNHNQLMSDVQAKGMHEAYENAQAQFERDRQAAAAQNQFQMGADQFNVGTRMQHGQFGLQNDQFNRGMAMDFGRLGLQNDQFNRGMHMQHGQLGLMNQQFNIDKDMRYGLAGLDVGRFNRDMAMNYGQMGLQNQQFNIGTNMDYGRARLQNSQFNESQRMSAADIHLRQQVAQEQARLGAAGHRLGAITGMGGFASGIADIGRAQFGMMMDKYNALNMMGEQQRNINQSALDFGYDEFMRRQNHGRDGLTWQTGLMNGMPLPGSSFRYDSGALQRAPSMTSTIAGGLTGMLGAYAPRR